MSAAEGYRAKECGLIMNRVSSFLTLTIVASGLVSLAIHDSCRDRIGLTREGFADCFVERSDTRTLQSKLTPGVIMYLLTTQAGSSIT